MLDLAASGGLGTDLVIQTPYGDSGQTTFFVANESDWKADERKKAGEEVKVMRRMIPAKRRSKGSSRVTARSSAR